METSGEALLPGLQHHFLMHVVANIKKFDALIISSWLSDFTFDAE